MNVNDINNAELNYLTLKLTGRCNLNCKMCGQVYSDLRTQANDLDYELIEKRIKECKSLKTVYLFGGEPFLYKKMPELLESLSEQQLDVLISSNGIFLEKYLDDLIKNKVHDISISLDSFEENICDSIRGKGVLNKVKDALDKLIAAKKEKNAEFPYIGLNCVVLNENYKKLCEYYHYVEEHYKEIDRVNFESPITVPEKLGKEYCEVMQREFQLDPKAWEWFNSKIEAFSTEDLDIIFQEIEALKKEKKATFQAPTSFESVVDTFTENYQKQDRICVYPFSMLAILPNGDATFCVDFPDYIVGNIKEQSLEEIFYGEKATKFRDYILKNKSIPICARCPHRFDKDEFLINAQ